MQSALRKEEARLVVELDSQTRGLVSVIERRADFGSMLEYRQRCAELMHLIERKQKLSFWHLRFTKKPDKHRKVPACLDELRSRHRFDIDNLSHRHEGVDLLYDDEVKLGTSLQGRKTIVSATKRQIKGQDVIEAPEYRIRTDKDATYFHYRLWDRDNNDVLAFLAQLDANMLKEGEAYSTDQSIPVDAKCHGSLLHVRKRQLHNRRLPLGKKAGKEDEMGTVMKTYTKV